MTSFSREVMAVAFSAIGAFLVLGCGGGSGSARGSSGGGLFSAPAEPEPTMRFGVVWDDLVVDSGKVTSGQSLSHLLDPAGIGPGRIATLAANSRKTWDVRYMKAGHRWWLASETVRDSADAEARLVPKWFIYERNPKDYALFSLGDTLAFVIYPVDTVTQGLGPSKLLVHGLRQGRPPNQLPWPCQRIAGPSISAGPKGDTYDVTYRREVVNGTPVDARGAVQHLHLRPSNRGLQVRNDGIGGYFDLEGGSLQKVFLAPLSSAASPAVTTPSVFTPAEEGQLWNDYAAPQARPLWRWATAW